MGRMKTLKYKNGDICFENNELQLVEGDAEIAQSIEITLKTRLGEFELDEHVGIERENLLGKNLDDEEAIYDIISAISQDERIESVENVEFLTGKTKRSRSINIKMNKADDDTVIEMEGVDLA
ncbi:DUF2634 domain-containing protein [Bacillus vallismortis]|uniref:DUF2634 domain-containing protein n=1 Tax=Bacillus vallismortis TaxID=72361 RepID=UPI0022818D9E|nr:DUF2634 domain-containing protein [Bacillus vallismortis]MCY7919566.1 DUF2634 domain-containing protein [Bacillus vallismortis]